MDGAWGSWLWAVHGDLSWETSGGSFLLNRRPFVRYAVPQEPR